MKIHIIIAPTCFGLRPSSGMSLAKVTFLLKHSVKSRHHILCGDMAACREMACVLFVAQTVVCTYSPELLMMGTEMPETC
jgi:hypothetical protein